MLEKSDLDLLTQELKPAQYMWKEIGRELYPHHKEERTHESIEDVLYFPGAGDICSQFSELGDRLRQMLSEQLQYPYPTTWRNIMDALRSPDIGQSQLANHLEAKYCPSEFIKMYFSECNMQYSALNLKHAVCCVDLFSVNY